jgi:phytoene dehydrogenase-like protein
LTNQYRPIKIRNKIEEREMKKIVIIGSGIGGLTAGNLLARKGHEVTIFESYSTPGGQTAEKRKTRL